MSTINQHFESHAPLILIVDDEKTLRLVLRRAMEREGYQVLEASSGEECLEVCLKMSQESQPDMILLDAMMPGINGFTCCEQLHQKLEEECPPILMITVLDDQASVDLAFDVGATDYLTKPIHWAVLRQRVRRILQSRWALAELKRQIEKERLLTEELEVMNQELKRLASVDGLTQLSNRRHFDEYLEREWKRLRREQLPLSLILCDIDFFKPYNDTYGHQAGDECIKQVAAVLKACARRPADLAARYGGEEFVIVLPNTDLDGAIAVAERIQNQVKTLHIPHLGSQIREFVTVSLGISSVIPHPDASPELLIFHADKALYQAKIQGRDRYCTYIKPEEGNS